MDNGSVEKYVAVISSKIVLRSAVLYAASLTIAHVSRVSPTHWPTSYSLYACGSVEMWQIGQTSMTVNL